MCGGRTVEATAFTPLDTKLYTRLTAATKVPIFMKNTLFVIFEYRGIHEKGSGDIVSAVCAPVQQRKTHFKMLKIQIF